MKGITTHVMVIIFSLIIMVVLLVVGIGFVQNYTNIPFEKLWDLTPQSGIATEPGYVSGGGGSASDTMAKRFFTTAPKPYDLSEIACDIGTDIYNDFSVNGNKNSRSGINIDFGNGEHLYEVGKGTFIYNNTQYPDGQGIGQYGHSFPNNYVTGTDTRRPADSVVFGNAGPQYAACHICREPEQQGDLKLGFATKVGGIKDLDEICINMQLRDRKAYTKDFCRDTFYISGTGYKFGNCVGWELGGSGGEDYNNELINTALSNPNNWQTFDSSNCAELTPSFCNNNNDYIRWIATVNAYAVPWEITENYCATTLCDESNVKLVDGYKYIYYVWWDTARSPIKYTIEFTAIPNENTIPTFTNFDTIGNYFSNWRANDAGRLDKEPRTLAIFNVNLANPLAITTLRDKIGSLDARGRNAVTCSSCNSPPDSEPKYFKTWTDADCSATKITLWTNATVPGGNNGDLPSGNYRVIIRSWKVDGNPCIYDRSAILYKI